MTEKQNEVVSNIGKKLNGFTITAIVMAAVGLIVNFFSIISIIGIVFGGIGVAKSRNTKDKTWAIISLGLSIFETVLWFITVANALAAL